MKGNVDVPKTISHYNCDKLPEESLQGLVRSLKKLS